MSESRRRYLAPQPETTGGLIGQPRANQSRSSWYVVFDRMHGVHVLDAGFLDAPDRLPTGSVRAADIGDITLGISHVRRPGEELA